MIRVFQLDTSLEWPAKSRRMKKIILSALLLSLLFNCSSSKEEASEAAQQGTSPSRYVEQNILVSDTLPDIKIKVAEEFNYAGSFYFEIIAASEEYPDSIRGKAVAAGDRFVFTKADKNKKLEKLFIVQLEGFLLSNDFIYNYRFDQAEQIGGRKYRHNTWFYNNRQLSLENPNNEGAKTLRFLEDKGYKLEDEFMMSRFVGLASEDRKHEIIIFYIEMMKGSIDHSIESFEALPEEEQRKIEERLAERSRKSFIIME